MAAIGTVIDGKYEILKLVGKGGMSKVYLAMDKRLNKQWAVKEIEKKARDKNNAVVIQSAIAEANMIKKLDHRTLPRIVDIIDNGNVIYIIMDYIEGESLNKVLERDGAQNQAQVIEWAKELCEVLDYLHTRNPHIIYRDMKPANIMLKPDGSLKLIDFGIAREYKEQNLEDTVSLGTKGYAAPEQFGGKGQTDERTDIYCLGVTLYHLVTGQDPCEPPYELYPIRHWNPSLSAGLESIIQKCTQLNPVDRYQSCAELMYALDHYEEEDEVYRNRQRSKLNKFVYSAFATVFCVLMGCLFLLLNANDNNKNYLTFIETAKNNTEFYVNTEKKEDSSNDKENAKINQYFAAIDIKPGNLKEFQGEENPYFAIVEACKDRVTIEYDNESDDVKKEEIKEELDVIMNNLITKLNLNFDENEDSELYAELSYVIAEYYLYFSPNQDAKKFELATPWVEKAQKSDNKYKQPAQLMHNILAFNNTVKTFVKHPNSNNSDEFNVQLEALKQSIQIAQSSESNTTKYDVYHLSLLVLGQQSVIKYLKDNENFSKVQIENIIGTDLEELVESQGKDNSKRLSDAYFVFEQHLSAEYGGD